MTDLISRQDAIARIKQEMLERKTPFTAEEIGFWRGMLFCVEALANMPSAVALATNEINALKDALAQAEGEFAELQRDLNLWMYSEQYPRY